MALAIKQLHTSFVGEAGPIDLRTVIERARLDEIRHAMDRYGVLVFHDQKLSEREQADFAARLDGTLHTQTGSNALQKNRFGIDAVSDVSNVDAEGRILEPNDRRRLQRLANRLWHTDASFRDPPGRYSMLFAHVLPPVASNTEFADMRAAYDALPEKRKAELEELRGYHSIAHSRQMLGFEFTETEAQMHQGAFHPIVRTIPGSQRKSLYIGSYVSMIEGWPVPEGRLLVRELMEHATREPFVFSHSWSVGDLVIWDNRTTMHRATSFDDRAHVREMRRVATLDINPA